MVSSRDTAAELVMDNPDKTEVWLHVFSAKCRHKKLRDTDDSKEITDFFIATAGLNAIQQVTTMVKPYNLEDMNFADIEQIIMEKNSSQEEIDYRRESTLHAAQPTARRVYQRLCTMSPEGCTVLQI